MTKKPPLGLKPKKIFEYQRYNEVCSAIARYYEANLKIPIDWIIEYNELVEKTQQVPKQKTPNINLEWNGELSRGTNYSVSAFPQQETLYSKEDVLKAGEIGEINHFDYKHIVSLLDEAKAINKSLKKPKKD
jgi:hypothetical protein